MGIVFVAPNFSSERRISGTPRGCKNDADPPHRRPAESRESRELAVFFVAASDVAPIRFRGADTRDVANCSSGGEGPECRIELRGRFAQGGADFTQPGNGGLVGSDDFGSQARSPALGLRDFQAIEPCKNFLARGRLLLFQRLGPGICLAIALQRLDGFLLEISLSQANGG